MILITTFAQEDRSIGIFVLAALLVPRIHALWIRENETPQMMAWIANAAAPERVLSVDPKGLPAITPVDLLANLLCQKCQQE